MGIPIELSVLVERLESSMYLDMPLVVLFCDLYNTSLKGVHVGRELGYPELYYTFTDGYGGYTREGILHSLCDVSYKNRMSSGFEFN